MLNGASATGTPEQFLDTADAAGDVHGHVDFDLLNDATAPAGIYGVMLQVHADQGGDGSLDIVSDPFWFLFNHQLSEDDFEEGIAAFGAVPEPGSLTLLLGGALCVLGRRRRK